MKKIGVLEVLNKVGGEPFSEEERFLLQNFAEEIAFAIRNGKMFEVVVKAMQAAPGAEHLQGLQKPPRSWTPCVKYREASVEV